MVTVLEQIPFPPPYIALYRTQAAPCFRDLLPPERMAFIDEGNASTSTGLQAKDAGCYMMSVYNVGLKVINQMS